MKIIIGLPAYNEEKNIAKVIVQLKKISKNIIVCNDGSTDLTSEIAENLGAIVVNHQKNKGYGAAIKSLFDKAKEMDSDILITFDADGQHNVSEIKNVLTPLISKKADIVIGSRFLGDGEGKISRFKDLAAVGTSNSIATRISGVFWIFMASLLGTEGYGQFSYFIAIASIASVITFLGIGNSTNI